MKLSEPEKKLVRRLQKNQRAWRWMRWFSLVMSAVFIGLIYDTLTRMPAMMSDSSGLMVVAFVSPICWLLLFITSFLLGCTVAFWNGDPKTRLLLRLLEDHEDDDA